MSSIQLVSRVSSRPVYNRRARAFLFLAAFMTAAAAAQAQERIPSRARDVELHGLISPRNRQIQAELRAFVATPFGRIPVTGRGTLFYTCAGRFAGTLDYNAIIRILAQLKGIDLVRSVEGRVSFQQPPSCGAGPDIPLHGRAMTDSLNVRGAVRLPADSIAFGGTLWFDGKDHHGIVSSTGHANRMDLTFTMRGPRGPQPMLTQRQP